MQILRYIDDSKEFETGEVSLRRYERLEIIGKVG